MKYANRNNCQSRHWVRGQGLGTPERIQHHRSYRNKHARCGILVEYYSLVQSVPTMKIELSARGAGKTYKMMQWLIKNPNTRYVITFSIKEASRLQEDYPDVAHRIMDLHTYLEKNKRGQLSGIHSEYALDNADMMMEQMFGRPISVATFTKEKASKEVAYSEFFDKFWEAYPKKKAKPPAIRAFNALKVDAKMFEVMMTALEKHKRSDQWNRGTGQFIPMPSTWLNQRRWEDVVESVPSTGLSSKYDGI